jgi:hypothetical protein
MVGIARGPPPPSVQVEVIEALHAIDRPVSPIELSYALHPDHLTPDEIVSEMAVDPQHGDDNQAVGEAIRRLMRSGLVRPSGEVIAPTHAALRAAALLLET